MRVLGIIPARGGSKGIPGKNIRMLAGKPLIQYTIEAARAARHISETIVSTDDHAIKSIAVEGGALVPFDRPAELALDATPTIDVVLHALVWYEDQGVSFDAICLLQPTTPFREAGAIDAAISKFFEEDCDALISVRRVPSEWNPHWTFEGGLDGFLKIATGEKHIITRRQDLPPAYFRDGSIYLTRTHILREQRSLYGERLSFIVSDSPFYVNIDTEADWEIAKRLAAQKIQTF